MDLKIFTDNIEETAREQINTLLSQDAFKDCKVRIMPDVHAGAGCVIGFIADLGDKVIPNIVGVDIGCGLLVVELGKIDIDLERLDKVIRQYVPSGRSVHSRADVSTDDHAVKMRCWFYRDSPLQISEAEYSARSLGTLGGGNHFIEIDIDDDGNKYLVIHTGSRNLGKQVADIYQNLAIDLMSGKFNLAERQNVLVDEYKKAGRFSEIQSAIKKLHAEYKTATPDIPKSLCYLTGAYREDYLHDMKLCQEYAIINRWRIADIICQELWGVSVSSCDYFSTIHNYIDHDSNIVRKGAISAKDGEKLLIPINMRDGCILGVGKGNEDWNYSAPHGAGRIMSRMEAKRRLTMDDYQKSMNGIYTTSVAPDTIDGAPMAYKPMQEIIDNIAPSVQIEKIIKPIYNFKASE